MKSYTLTLTREIVLEHLRGSLNEWFKHSGANDLLNGRIEPDFFKIWHNLNNLRNEEISHRFVEHCTGVISNLFESNPDVTDIMMVDGYSKVFGTTKIWLANRDNA
jgi:hypothetical protein